VTAVSRLSKTWMRVERYTNTRTSRRGNLTLLCPAAKHGGALVCASFDPFIAYRGASVSN
jgi:hypothetical protein